MRTEHNGTNALQSICAVLPRIGDSFVGREVMYAVPDNPHSK